jgi:hypothetical protein
MAQLAVRDLIVMQPVDFWLARRANAGRRPRRMRQIFWMVGKIQ